MPHCFAFLCNLSILFTASRAFWSNCVIFDHSWFRQFLICFADAACIFHYLDIHYKITWSSLVNKRERHLCFCIQCMDLFYFIFVYLTTMQLHRDIFNFLSLWRNMIIVVQAGKQLVELVANPDQRNDTRESMDLHGVQRWSMLWWCSLTGHKLGKKKKVICLHFG